MRAILIVLLFLVFQSSIAQVVSEWRGPGRTGIYEETGLLKEWPEGGPEKLWSSAEVLKGYSSPAIGKDYIYVTGKKDSVEYITALDYDRGNRCSFLALVALGKPSASPVSCLGQLRSHVELGNLANECLIATKLLGFSARLAHWLEGETQS